ncbi:MAG: hypothetical protein Kow00129_05800 [Thermoleophilia bacterium]
MLSELHGLALAAATLSSVSVTIRLLFEAEGYDEQTPDGALNRIFGRRLL